MKRYNVSYVLTMQDKDDDTERKALGNEWVDAETGAEAIVEAKKEATKKYHKVIEFTFIEAEESNE